MTKYEPGTFITVPNIKYLNSKPAEMRSIFFYLCERANDEGLSWPSRRSMSKESGCGLASVDKYLKQLEDECFILKKTRSDDEGKQTSNLYQIILKTGLSQKEDTPSIENETGVGIKNDTRTITNINYKQLTIESDVPSDALSEDLDNPNQEVDPAGLLPERFGKTPILRLANVYRGLWLTKMGTPKNEFSYPRFGKAMNSLMQYHSEIQIVALMDSFFDWHGSSGDNPKDNVFLQGNSFRIESLVSMSDTITAFIKNNLNIKYDDPERIRDFVKRQLLKKNVT